MLQKLLRKKSGFTLIELMIVVVIIGVLASVAIPAFIRFVKRSKTSEATSLTKSLFEGATTYWNAINDTQGLTAVNTAASASTHCTVAAQSTTNTINEQKTQLDVTASGMESFAALGWSPSGPVLYQYVILGSSDACAVTATVGTAVYTFQALGDIDADSSKSTFELQVGRDSEGALYHGAGFYMVDELESGVNTM